MSYIYIGLQTINTAIPSIMAVFLTIVVIYCAIVILAASFPDLQNYLFYLHRVPFIKLNTLSTPEKFGFSKGQVHQFFIETDDHQKLYAWHISSSLDTFYAQEEKKSTISHRIALLQKNEKARLVIYFHGASGCIASRHRPASYRIFAEQTSYPIHVLAFDYRGYGLSSGTPSEKGLVKDGIAVVDWALNVARIPAERIVICGHSLGTAVALAIMQYYIQLQTPILFSSHILIAPFSDIATLIHTYRVEGIIPILSPLKRIPMPFLNGGLTFLDLFNSFLTNHWPSKQAMRDYVKFRETNPTVSNQSVVHLIHAKDDSAITVEHSRELFFHAVNAKSKNIRYDDLFSHTKPQESETDYTIHRDYMRLTILNHGAHEKITINPLIGRIVVDAFNLNQTSIKPR